MNKTTPTKTDRNNRLVKWHEEHPTWSITAIARMFKISRQRASQIIESHYKRIEKSQNANPAPTAQYHIGKD